MQHPHASQVPVDRVDKLLAFAALPSLHSFPAPVDRLEEFGLADAAYHLRLDQVLIRLGNADPVTRGRYVLVDDTVHLVPDHLYHHLLAVPASLLE